MISSTENINNIEWTSPYQTITNDNIIFEYKTIVDVECQIYEPVIEKMSMEKVRTYIIGLLGKVRTYIIGLLDKNSLDLFRRTT
jgi:hypothetical protein